MTDRDWIALNASAARNIRRLGIELRKPSKEQYLLRLDMVRRRRDRIARLVIWWHKHQWSYGQIGRRLGISPGMARVHEMRWRYRRSAEYRERHPNAT